MPPDPMSAVIRYGPTNDPIAEPPSTSAGAITAETRGSRKSAASGAIDNSASTSPRSCASLRQASARNAGRSLAVSARPAWYSSSTRRQRSVRESSRIAKLPIQPRLRELPIARHGVGRHAEHGRRLFDAQAGEEAQLDDAAFAWIHVFERRQRIVERDDVGIARRQRKDGLVELHAHAAAGALRELPRPGGVDEDVPHQPAAQREEVRAVLPLQALHASEPHVRLVD